MAKSAGNEFVLADLEERGFDPLAFRYLCFTVRYRHRMNFTFSALRAGERALTGLRDRVWEWRGEPAPDREPPRPPSGADVSTMPWTTTSTCPGPWESPGRWPARTCPAAPSWRSCWSSTGCSAWAWTRSRSATHCPRPWKTPSPGATPFGPIESMARLTGCARTWWPRDTGWETPAGRLACVPRRSWRSGRRGGTPSPHPGR